jgi:hypothetical protein
LRPDLGGDHAISRHDVAHHRIARIVRRVGDQDAGAPARRLGSGINRVVIGSAHPDDVGALQLDALRAEMRHAGGQENPGRRSGECGGRRDCEAVVAVTRAEQGGQARGAVSDEPLDGDAGDARERPEPGVGPSERLEAPERAASFVLDEHLRDAEPAGEPRQIEERRRRVIR